MMMRNELLRKYFSGQCTAEEKEHVEQLLSGNDSGQILEEWIHEVEKGGETDEIPAGLIEEELQRFHAQVRPARVVMLPAARKLVAACSIVLLFSVSIWLFRRDSKRQEWVTLVNHLQTAQRVRLMDGSTAWLNAHASVEYDKHTFNREKREIKIKGEVFFDVAHDEKRPFIVHAGPLTTLVKGTAFNVEAFEGESDIRVTLVRGKVEVDAGGQRYTMAPGERVNYSTQQQMIDVKKVDAAGCVQWTSGLLIFDDLPLEDVLHRLEGFYNIRIVCRDTALLKGLRIRGQYQPKAAGEVLRKILFIHGLSFSTRGDSCFIEKD